MNRQQIITGAHMSQKERGTPHRVTTLVRLGSLLLVVAALAGSLTRSWSDSDSPSRQGLPTIAGMPYEAAQEIVDRRRPELLQVPGVYAVAVGKEGILLGVTIYTDEKGEKPATLPPALQALPSVIEGLPVEIQPVYVLPPPPGVIVLKPGGEYEQADVCPPGYNETQEEGWRFCNSRAHLEPIPPLMRPPIAGIPYMEAVKIMERHRAELMALPGVTSVGIGREGIFIEARDPSVLPQEVEGLPLESICGWKTRRLNPIRRQLRCGPWGEALPSELVSQEH